MTVEKKETKDSAIAGLKLLGFDDAQQKTPYRLVASISGEAKTGKSHFAFTAPDPIFLINIDIGTEGVLNKFQVAGKKIYTFDVRVSRKAGQDTYVPLWENLKKIFQSVYKVGEGTVIVDTNTEMYEIARLAKFGKLTQVMPHNYQEVNNEFREIMRLAYDSTMNTIFIHKLKAQYVNNIRTKEMDIAGPSDIEYSTQINLITYREDTDAGSEFSVQIEGCRHEPSVNKAWLRGDMCTFPFLLSMVHGR